MNEKEVQKTSFLLIKITKIVRFLILFFIVELLSQFFYNITNHYKISISNFVETYDNLQESIKKAYEETIDIKHHKISVLPNCLLLIFFLNLSDNLISSFFLSILFSLDGIFYLQTMSQQGALSISLLITSIFFSCELVLMHSCGRSINKQINYALLSFLTSFCSFILHQHLMPISLSVCAVIYSFFIIFPFRIQKTKLKNISQIFSYILCFSSSFCACYASTSLSSGFKLYPVSINDLYSLIYKQQSESYNARCKISNNVITSFLFWYSIINHSNERWKYLWVIILAGIITIYMESTLFDFRSANDPKNSNYYDFRILAFFIASSIHCSMDNKKLSSFLSFLVFIVSILWRFDIQSLINLYFPNNDINLISNENF